MTITDTNITIMIKNMDRSISFYQSIGFTVKNRWADHYAQLTAPGVVIGLHPGNDEHLTGGSENVSIGFTASNFEEAGTLLNNRPLS
ncbi:MAG: VOC family protein [Panacibacter sp.]